MNTIFAVSSGAPPAAIAIVRLSGPEAFRAARALAGTLPPPRQAALRTLRRPDTREVLDRAMVLAFPAPRTSTGEDVVELHLHGGRAVVRAVEGALAAEPELRRAEPGEFTRRALTNGVIDLTEAEGLGDLLAAETEAQRRSAIGAAGGALRRTIEDWADRLIGIAARIEAQLDFSEEDDVPGEAVTSIKADVAALVGDITAVLVNPPVERLRDGVRVVIAGPPNEGKSTLFNALAGRDAAIVSPIAGTTRDRIEASVVRNGIAYVLVDTAGLNEASGDQIEQIGICLAKIAIDEADIVLWLGDEEMRHLGLLRVFARSDLPDRRIAPSDRDVAVSVATGEGLSRLWNLIAHRAVEVLPREDIVATNLRQRALLQECCATLDSHTEDFLLMAEHVRLALGHLNAITGRVNLEAVLDALFAQFCVGK